MMDWFLKEVIVEESLDNGTSPGNPQLYCGINSIRRRLQEGQIRPRKPAKKIMLNEDRRVARVNFAQQNLNRDWSRVIFLDEKTFSSSHDSKLPLWRLDNTRYEPNHVLDTQRSGRISVRVLGWILSDGPGELVQIGGRMNRAQYVRILNDILLPGILDRYAHPRPITVVQDNSRVHTCRIVRTWLEAHRDEIEMLPWPAKSPDLHPIENV
ncbi:hypothetical protein ILUMI_16338 [Ignelater luminosus]|uniref:Tc1-like transposase DDE domain-containing protein n=1 Tax=Ignelater luminosus TaxID=2038154 RepID=A0A8K0CM28_IGNLU|nr:hypothetical protein ILUMI_16338 [Ignelater luminosus]